MSRKERERLLKRSEIISSAKTLFAEKGYEGTKLEDIADAAEFGKGTIYNYFSNKEEIFAAIIDEITQDYLNILTKINKSEKTFLGFITALTNEMIRFCREDYYSFLLLIRTKTEMSAIKHIKNSVIVKNYLTKSSEIFEKKISTAIKNKEIRKIDPNSFIILYRSIIFPYFHSLLNFKDHNNLELEKAGEFILSVLFNGIKA